MVLFLSYIRTYITSDLILYRTISSLAVFVPNQASTLTQNVTGPVGPEHLGSTGPTIFFTGPTDFSLTSQE